jgi:uncharacterized FlaG/YvyC family protein
MHSDAQSNKHEGLVHDIERALDRINTELSFKIRLSAREQEIFDHFVQWN